MAAVDARHRDPSDDVAAALAANLDTPGGRHRAVRQVRTVAATDASAAYRLAGRLRVAARFTDAPDDAVLAEPVLGSADTVLGAADPTHVDPSTTPRWMGSWRSDPLDSGTRHLILDPAPPTPPTVIDIAGTGVAAHDQPNVYGLRAAPIAEFNLAAEPVPVPGTAVRPRLDPRTWRIFDENLRLAVEVGILDGFLTAARSFLVEHARPWHESGVAEASRDPHAIATFGQAYAQHRALRQLARDAFATLLTPVAGDLPDGWPPRPVVVARWYARQRLGGLITSVIGVLGASGTSERFALDRYWRDLRIHAYRHPPRWPIDSVITGRRSSGRSDEVPADRSDERLPADPTRQGGRHD